MSKKRRIIVVSFSGGKDSLATLILAIDEAKRDGCDLVVLTCDTGNEHEWTIAYIKVIEAFCGLSFIWIRPDFSKELQRKRELAQSKWIEEGFDSTLLPEVLGALQPTGNSFLDLCLWKGRFPARMSQFCTFYLKKIPMLRHTETLLDQYESVESWQGVRADESLNRKNLPKTEMTPEGFLIVRPVLEMTAQQVVDLAVSRGWPLNPLYKAGMNRVGCMPCINCSKSELRNIAARFPEHIDRIRSWEQLVAKASKRQMATFFRSEAEVTTMSEHGIDANVEWANTERGGRQFGIFTEPMDSCASAYGLCESGG